MDYLFMSQLAHYIFQ